MRKWFPLIYRALVTVRPNIVIDREVLRQSRSIARRSQYECFIGIEKKGLIWAGILSKSGRYPLVYYSLELYVEDHPELSSFYYLRGAEKRFNRRSKATIVQDKSRGAVLAESNGVLDAKSLVYFPISLRGDLVKRKSTFLHQKFGIDESKKIVLYFGSVFARRYLDRLVEMAEGFTDDIVLVVLGHGADSYREYLQSIAKSGKAIVSNEFIPEHQVLDVVSSADIGVALFQTTNANDRLVAFSSLKISYYIRCGVPVFAFDTESSRRLTGAFKCGELINGIDELPAKVQAIVTDYERYQDEAYMAFSTFFSFDRTFPAMYSHLNALVGNGHEEKAAMAESVSGKV